MLGLAALFISVSQVGCARALPCDVYMYFISRPALVRAHEQREGDEARRLKRDEQLAESRHA